MHCMQMHWPPDLVVGAPNQPDPRAALRWDWAARAAQSQLPGEGDPPDDRAPGGVVALDVMRSDWPEVADVIGRVRGAYLARFPRARAGCTLGDLERLLTVVVAVPGYQLARQHADRPPGPLHPVLDSLVRHGEILRRATRQLRLRPESGTLADARVRAADILSFMERQQGTEVAMVRLLLHAALDGANVAPLSAPHAVPVQRALDDLDAAFDYALLGLQASAVAGALGPLLARIHAPVASLLHGSRQDARQPALDRLQAWAHDVDTLLQDHGLDSTAGRAILETMHAETYAQCATGLGDPVRQSLWARLAVEPAELHEAAADKLRMVLRRRCGRAGSAGAAAVEWLLGCLMHTFARLQQILALGEEIQRRMAALGGSPQPPPARSTVDLQHVIFKEDGVARRLPALLAELEQVLGFRATMTAGAIEISARDA